MSDDPQSTEPTEPELVIDSDAGLQPGVVHIAGLPIQMEGRYIRQRCGWCGAMIEDIDLTMIAVAGEDTSVPLWTQGHLISIDGGLRCDLGSVEEVPSNCCAAIDLSVTQ